MMSDCERCWSTPCLCGWDYIGWSKKQLESQIEMLKEILSLTSTHKGNKEMIRAEFLQKQKKEVERMLKQKEV